MMFTIFCCQCGVPVGEVSNRIEENELYQCEDCEDNGKICKSERFRTVIRYSSQTGKKIDIKLITDRSLYYDQGIIKSITMG